MKFFLIVLAVIALSISACGKQEAEQTKPGAGRSDDRQAVMVETLSLRDIDEYVSVSGKLEGITDIVMNSESSGRVMELYKKLGDKVEQGERIGRLENDVSRIRVDQAEAAFMAAESSMQNADRNLDYAESAKAQNLISEAEYNTALSAFKGAKAAYDGANAALESARLAYNNSYLVAPAAGKISYLHVAVGQLVSPGMPIASITDASTLILKSGVGESQISKLRTGLPVVVDFRGKSYSGKVRGFGIRPISGSANYPLEIEINSSKDLLPGMVVKARIKTNTYRNMLYTPLTNVAKEFDNNYLWVLNSRDNQKISATRQEVSLGRTIGQYVELLSGAAVGDTIVVSGSENLEDGSLVKIRE